MYLFLLLFFNHNVRMSSRYSNGQDVDDMLEDGYIDLRLVKAVNSGVEESIDIAALSKRYCLDGMNSRQNVISLLYGVGHSENRKLYFMAPYNMAKIWLTGLRKIINAFQKMRWQTDKRIQHLKFQYLQLFYEGEKCQGPTPAEAIKVKREREREKCQGIFPVEAFKIISQFRVIISFVCSYVSFLEHFIHVQNFICIDHTGLSISPFLELSTLKEERKRYLHTLL